MSIQFDLVPKIKKGNKCLINFEIKNSAGIICIYQLLCIHDQDDIEKYYYQGVPSIGNSSHNLLLTALIFQVQQTKMKLLIENKNNFYKYIML